MKRLGKADMGVSMLLFGAVEDGGLGRANGLGGPCAPALRSALALGEGGGSTTPDEWLPSVPPAPLVDGPPPAVLLAAWGEEVASPLPPSDTSSGICTFSCGRLPPGAPPHCALFVRCGGAISGKDDIEVFPRLWLGCFPGRGGAISEPAGLLVLLRETAPTSTDCARLEGPVCRTGSSLIGASLGGSLVLVPQCFAKNELVSSTGVKILLAFTNRLGSGIKPWLAGG